MKEGKIKQTVIIFCVAVTVFFMVTVVMRMLTKNILINRMGMDNLFTRFIFYGDDEVMSLDTAEGETNTARMRIDWQEFYPFEAKPGEAAESTEAVQEEGNRSAGAVRRLEQKADMIRHGIERYTSNHLAGYSSLVKMSNAYEKLIGWNIAALEEYNGVVEFSDGHLMVYSAQMNVNSSAEALIRFYESCQQKEIDFLYVQAPYKICKYEDTDVSGIIDFSNQNADALLEGAENGGVPCLDLREEFHKTGMPHHDLFYRTDHHWTTETALQAAAAVADRLNQEFGFSIDLSLYGEEAFEKKVYEDWFLGSSGKKITLARTEPDDISLFYPRRETSLTYKMPELGIDTTGDFSVTYDMSQIEEKDLYRLDPYGAYNHSGGALVQIHNEGAADGRKVLFIGDSYLNSVFPFMSLGIEYTDMLDLRDFSGSVESYINQTEPDIVVILYNPTSIETVKESGHTGTFDFR